MRVVTSQNGGADSSGDRLGPQIAIRLVSAALIRPNPALHVRVSATGKHRGNPQFRLLRPQNVSISPKRELARRVRPPPGIRGTTRTRIDEHNLPTRRTQRGQQQPSQLDSSDHVDLISTPPHLSGRVGKPPNPTNPGGMHQNIHSGQTGDRGSQGGLVGQLNRPGPGIRQLTGQPPQRSHIPTPQQQRMRTTKHPRDSRTNPTGRTSDQSQRHTPNLSPTPRQRLTPPSPQLQRSRRIGRREHRTTCPATQRPPSRAGRHHEARAPPQKTPQANNRTRSTERNVKSHPPVPGPHPSRGASPRPVYRCGKIIRDLRCGLWTAGRSVDNFPSQG